MNHDQLNQERTILRDYPFSRDYTALEKLLETQAVVCVCVCDVAIGEAKTTRHVGKAFAFKSHTKTTYVLKCFGRTILRETLQTFIKLCEAHRLEFLMPCTGEPAAGPKPFGAGEFFMWIGIAVTSLAAVTILFIVLFNLSRP